MRANAVRASDSGISSFAPVSFVMAVIMTFFELLVQVLQAYVFTVLTAAYLAGALEAAH